MYENYRYKSNILYKFIMFVLYHNEINKSHERKESVGTVERNSDFYSEFDPVG